MSPYDNLGFRQSPPLTPRVYCTMKDFDLEAVRVFYLLPPFQELVF